MIVLRNKTFGRENHRKLKYEERYLPDPELIKRFGKLISKYEADTKYANDLKKLGPIDRKRVDALKKDIKAGYIYEDGPNGGETEFLDFPSKNSHLMSKKIDNQHRFNYRVYEPNIEMNEKTEDLEYIQKIVYESCWGHETNGGRTYSEKDN